MSADTPLTLRQYADQFLKTRESHDEFSGKCPFCGDETHFHASFKYSAEGKAWCHLGCTNEGGPYWSGAWFTSKLYGISYTEARKLYGLEVGKPAPRKSEAEWKAEREKEVEDSLSVCQQEWSEKAEEVLAKFKQGLSSPEAVAYLEKERGLSRKTCEAFEFGYCTAYEKMPRWDGKDGEPYYFPVGVVMPVRRGGSLIGFTVRRKKPWGKVRFHDVWGGPKVPLLYGPQGGLVIVVESILDAASIYQATGGKVGIIGGCGKDIVLDKAARDMLLAAKIVLIVQDADISGTILAQRVREIRPANSENVPEGKDANGYLVAKGTKALYKWILEAAKRVRTNATAQSVQKSKVEAHSVKENPVSLSASKEETAQKKAEEVLSPILDKSCLSCVPIDAPFERNGLNPVSNILTQTCNISIKCDTPLSCLMSFYAGIRLLAYPDGRVILRDPQGREGLAQYVAAYESEIWEEMAGDGKKKKKPPLELETGAVA